jgi:hypothetical protein
MLGVFAKFETSFRGERQAEGGSLRVRVDLPQFRPPDVSESLAWRHDGRPRSPPCSPTSTPMIQ